MTIGQSKKGEITNIDNNVHEMTQGDVWIAFSLNLLVLERAFSAIND